MNLPPIVNFNIEDLHRYAPGYKDVSLLPTIYGKQETDGVTRFQETITRSLTQGYPTIFASNRGETKIPGFEFCSRLSAEEKEFAGLDIIWSLWKEPGQTFLRYLQSEYNVEWIECFRQRLGRPKEIGLDSLSGELTLGVCYNDTSNLWYLFTTPIESTRGASNHILLT